MSNGKPVPKIPVLPPGFGKTVLKVPEKYLSKQADVDYVYVPAQSKSNESDANTKTVSEQLPSSPPQTSLINEDEFKLLSQAYVDTLLRRVNPDTGGLKLKAFTTASNVAQSIDTSLITTVNAIQDLAAISQGSAANQRLGTAVRAKYIDIVIQCHVQADQIMNTNAPPVAFASTPPVFKAFLFCDKMPIANAVAQRATYFVGDPQTGGNAAALYAAAGPDSNVIAPRNYVTQPRYHIYEEHTHCFNNAYIPATVAAGNTTQAFMCPTTHIIRIRHHFDGPGLLINWYTTGDATTWLTNSLHLGVMCNTVFVAGGQPRVNWRYRAVLGFEDEQDD